MHELRHTHATLLLRDGVPVHIVAKRLGHKDPSVTLNVYADVIPDDDGHAMDAFSRAVGRLMAGHRVVLPVALERQRKAAVVAAEAEARTLHDQVTDLVASGVDPRSSEVKR